MEGSRVEHKLEVGREARRLLPVAPKPLFRLRRNPFFASFVSAFCPFFPGFYFGQRRSSFKRGSGYFEKTERM